MPDRRYRLSEAADADLESLYEWGIDRFGVNSADRYFDGLIARLGEIADTPQLWPEVDADSDDDAHLFRTIDAHAFR
jgi:plasmid stabilization system protein ParE